MFKLLINLSLYVIVFLSCSAVKQSHVTSMPSSSNSDFLLDADCPGEEYVFALYSAIMLSDTVGIDFEFSLWQTSGAYNYNSVISFNAQDGVTASLLFYLIPHGEGKDNPVCVGRASWNVRQSNEQLKLPLSAVYDAWGFRNYIVLLLIDDEPRLKQIIFGEKEAAKPTASE